MTIASFTLTGLPSFIAAGSTNVGLVLTVTALDEQNNIAEDYGGTIKIKSDDEVFPVPLNHTFSTSEKGIHTFIGGTTEWPTALIPGGVVPVTLSSTDTVNAQIFGVHSSIIIPPALCPTCHSDIGSGSQEPSDRTRGAQGTDSDGNPVPFFTDDPLLTPRGLSGEIFLSITHIRNVHIQEIQDLRNQQESDAGLPLTDFSDIDTNDHVSRRHIIELRESTERLLDAAGQTLEDYFKSDILGNEQPQNPRIAEIGGDDPQTEWVDVSRGTAYIDKTGESKSEFVLSDGSTTAPSPTIPERTHIRAIHVEDLRHHNVAAVSTPALLIQSRNGRLFEALLTGGATFTNTQEC